MWFTGTVSNGSLSSLSALVNDILAETCRRRLSQLLHYLISGATTAIFCDKMAILSRSH